MATKREPFGGKKAAPFGSKEKDDKDKDKAKKAPAKKAAAKRG